MFITFKVIASRGNALNVTANEDRKGPNNYGLRKDVIDAESLFSETNVRGESVIFCLFSGVIKTQINTLFPAKHNALQWCQQRAR